MTPERLSREISRTRRHLPDNEVQVWCASLDEQLTHLHALDSILSPEERERAVKFHFERDSNRFIVGRGLLRVILSRYLSVDPAYVELDYGSWGKPQLKTVNCDRILEFSLSHSANLVLYAFSWNRRVGVDIEYIRPISEIDSIVRQFFSSRERVVMRSLSPVKRIEAFFAAWTCKEAYLKAIGEGLTETFSQIEVSLAPGEPAKLVSIYGNKWKAVRWHLEAFEPAPNYLAALIAEGKGWKMTLQQPNLVSINMGNVTFNL